jgi:tetratricopeptide (TPR) repeat protein
MLFDLQSGRRKTVVRVVYSLLAASFLIGFVIFGVGSSGLGGVGDLISGGSGGDSAAQSAQQAAIDSAEKKLKKDPKDQKALVDLTRAYYLAGAGAADVDSNGQPIPSDDTITEWNKSLDVWERYLKTNPKPPDKQLAPQIANAYQAVGDFEGAAKTQQAIVEEDPNVFNYGRLAFFLYADGNLEAGKKAADTAISKAKGSQKKQYEKAFDQLAKQAESLQKASKAQSKASGNQLQDPFGGLSGGGSTPIVPSG